MNNYRIRTLKRLFGRNSINYNDKMYTINDIKDKINEIKTDVTEIKGYFKKTIDKLKNLKDKEQAKKSQHEITYGLEVMAHKIEYIGFRWDRAIKDSDEQIYGNKTNSDKKNNAGGNGGKIIENFVKKVKNDWFKCIDVFDRAKDNGEAWSRHGAGEWEKEQAKNLIKEVKGVAKKYKELTDFIERGTASNTSYGKKYESLIKKYDIPSWTADREYGVTKKFVTLRSYNPDDIIRVLQNLLKK